jgi:GTP-binding protein
VVRVGPERSFVLADVPGLIEGAAEGAGLGHQFLRHLRRTGLLLHFVDSVGPEGTADPVKDARVISAELKKFDATMARKPRWFVLNKIDLVSTTDRARLVADFKRRLRTKSPVFMLSAATGEGCRDLVGAVQKFLDDERVQRAPVPADGPASGEVEP